MRTIATSEAFYRIAPPEQAEERAVAYAGSETGESS
jgi:hypothetical protein